MAELTNLIDVPLTGAEEDLLKINKYVKALKKYINVATMPTTIAIQGEWGSGKTSLMNQIRYDLCDAQDSINLDAPFHGIWLNMWEYSMMKTPEEVLINVIKGLTTECTKLLERYNKNSEAVELLKKQAWTFLKKTAVFATKTAIKAGVNSIGLDGDAAVSAIVEGENGTSEKLDDEVRPSEFRDSLQKVITECLKADSKNGDTKKKGFLFFIDDLDRINPIDAVHILELLKNLFEVKDCIFILAIDYEVVVKGLKAKFGDGKQDDRAYRSFFDKIIQLPFSMPISAYDISNFLKNSLKNLNFMSDAEMYEEVTLEDDEKSTYLECIENFVYWSTGANPRAIKRLLNSLLLIQIMQEDESEQEEAQYKESYVKAINFAFVCVQIAYPEVYDCLLKENNFLEWDEESAHEFHLKRLEESKITELSNLKEFDEEWEQVLYRICQKTTFLTSRAQNISRLFNTVRYLVPNNKDFTTTIMQIIEMSAVTTVSRIDVAQKEQRKRRSSSDVLWERLEPYFFNNPEIDKYFDRSKFLECDNWRTNCFWAKPPYDFTIRKELMSRKKRICLVQGYSDVSDADWQSFLDIVVTIFNNEKMTFEKETDPRNLKTLFCVKNYDPNVMYKTVLDGKRIAFAFWGHESIKDKCILLFFGDLNFKTHEDLTSVAETVSYFILKLRELSEKIKQNGIQSIINS